MRLHLVQRVYLTLTMLQIFGEFIGVTRADKYDTANPEFWCKNCPDDARKNCPFVPTDNDNTTAGVQVPILTFVINRLGMIPLDDIATEFKNTLGRKPQAEYPQH